LHLMVTEGFEALLTVDRNLEFQQNLCASGIGVILVIARTNRLTELRPLVPAVIASRAACATG
jgi:hypothetical protein